MADRYDELVAIRQQAAHTRLVEGLQNQRQANLHDYRQAFAENNIDGMAWAEAEYNRNTRELMEVTGQAPQQQQPAQQFSAVEQQILREFPGLASDPKKMAEAVGASQALQLRGYDRNSSEYDNAMRMAIGLAGPDGRDGVEVASAQAALDAVNNSQIARKFGQVTPDQYNANAQWLHQNKKSGLYEPK